MHYLIKSMLIAIVGLMSTITLATVTSTTNPPHQPQVDKQLQASPTPLSTSS